MRSVQLTVSLIWCSSWRGENTCRAAVLCNARASALTILTGLRGFARPTGFGRGYGAPAHAVLFYLIGPTLEMLTVDYGTRWGKSEFQPLTYIAHMDSGEVRRKGSKSRARNGQSSGRSENGKEPRFELTWTFLTSSPTIWHSSLFILLTSIRRTIPRLIRRYTGGFVVSRVLRVLFHQPNYPSVRVLWIALGRFGFFYLSFSLELLL